MRHWRYPVVSVSLPRAYRAEIGRCRGAAEPRVRPVPDKTRVAADGGGADKVSVPSTATLQKKWPS